MSDDIHIEDQQDALDSLGPVDKSILPPLLNDENCACVNCQKIIPITDMPVRESGIVKVVEKLCKECQITFKDQARIACVKCKEVILWVDPHKEGTGFEFIRRRIYHCSNCPTCDPKLTSAQILEKVIFYKENNIPYE